VCGSSACSEAVAVWAIGGGDYYLPPDVGMKFGTGGYLKLLFQYHYNIKITTNSYQDHSGMRFHYNTTAPLDEAAILQVGDPLVQEQRDIPALTAVSHYEYTCPSECSSFWSGNINIISVKNHMHGFGRQMWTSVYRNAAKIYEIGRADYYHSEFQVDVMVGPFQVNKGDRINVHCVYNTLSSETPVDWGIATTDEMCIAFLTYYPKVTIQGTGTLNYCGLPSGGNTNNTFCNGITLNNVPQPIVAEPTNNFRKDFGYCGMDAMVNGLPPSNEVIIEPTAPGTTKNTSSASNLLIGALAVLLALITLAF